MLKFQFPIVAMSKYRMLLNMNELAYLHEDEKTNFIRVSMYLARVLFTLALIMLMV